MEDHTYAGKVEHASDVQAIEQVRPPVAPRLGQGDLRARDEDGLARVREEEGEDGGGVCEGVCAREDDETLVEIPVLRNERGDRVPL